MSKPATGAAPASGVTGSCAASSSAIRPARPQTKSVLLVEALVRSVPGLRIAHKSTSAQGVERAGRLQPDLILVDQQLPEFDDFDHYETKPIRFKPFLEALERRFPARAA